MSERGYIPVTSCLKTLLTEKHITLDQCGRMVGLREETIRAYCCETYAPLTIIIALRIARMLSCRVEDIWQLQKDDTDEEETEGGQEEEHKEIRR